MCADAHVVHKQPDTLVTHIRGKTTEQQKQQNNFNKLNSTKNNKKRKRETVKWSNKINRCLGEKKQRKRI